MLDKNENTGTGFQIVRGKEGKNFCNLKVSVTDIDYMNDFYSSIFS
jgi:hypothetical protein